MARFGERMAERTDNQTPHPAEIAEADFGLGRMDVDVAVLWHNAEE